MIWFGNGDRPQYATIWQVENKGNYSEVRMSTSRKDRDDNYKNSNWSFVRFIGKAHEAVQSIPERTRVTIRGGLDLEPYLDSTGTQKFPKSPKVVVFECNVVESDGSAPARRMDSPPVVADEEEMPF